MKKLRIAQIAPLWTRIPPRKYGGIELIIKSLCDHLVDRGHDVTLFATADSQTKAKLVSIRNHPLLEDKIRWTDYCFTFLNIAQAFQRYREFDIIHAHNDVNDLYFTSFVPTPTVHTLHNPLMKKKSAKVTPRVEVFNYYAKKTYFVSISKSQVRLGDMNIKPIKTIYNGINTDAFKFTNKPSDHFIWIARVDKSKGIGNAITAAKQAHAKLTLAGRLDYTQLEYFANQIKPRLERGRITFIGEIGAPQKNKFFGDAKALLYPIEWEEPFGLVMTEAMACGTPVIAFDRGSVREVVKDGVTGYVVKTIPEMVRAMKKVGAIDRRKCREWVEKKFSVPLMVDQYEALYERIIRTHKHKRHA